MKSTVSAQGMQLFCKGQEALSDPTCCRLGGAETVPGRCGTLTIHITTKIIPFPSLSVSGVFGHDWQQKQKIWDFRVRCTLHKVCLVTREVPKQAELSLGRREQTAGPAPHSDLAWLLE